ncbi:MAG: hypothetical protein JW950_05435 [Deltaproteobacteria bacterium]|nr:hypothetical protein [Deltaproteobacteria bacterium]
MYLTSFIHRDPLFEIAERWFRSCPEPGDCRSLTEILICDGFVINETLEVLTKCLLDMTHRCPYHRKEIRTKGELRDLICNGHRDEQPRVAELVKRYRENPDYYYREAPINAVVYLDDQDQLLGSFRIKRPKRIAEKANRKIAEWIFEKVIERAREMARQRAQLSGVPLNGFVTPADEMIREFIRAEEDIAAGFRDGDIRFDKEASAIHDVAAIKIVASSDDLWRLENILQKTDDIRVVEKQEFSGNYRAISLIIEVFWNGEYICRQYRENRVWKRYLDRGIPEADLERGLEVSFADAEPKMNVELILSTYPDMVESELGRSIHEERIIAQRDNRKYKGYIPMNIEFLVESLFAVGFSPRIDVDQVPIKLWGRYLPETLSSYIRRLHNLPEYDLIQ